MLVTYVCIAIDFSAEIKFPSKTFVNEARNSNQLFWCFFLYSQNFLTFKLTNNVFIRWFYDISIFAAAHILRFFLQLAKSLFSQFIILWIGCDRVYRIGYPSFCSSSTCPQIPKTINSHFLLRKKIEIHQNRPRRSQSAGNGNNR